MYLLLIKINLLLYQSKSLSFLSYLVESFYTFSISKNYSMRRIIVYESIQFFRKKFLFYWRELKIVIIKLDSIYELIIIIIKLIYKIMISFSEKKKAIQTAPIPESSVINKEVLEQFNSTELLTCSICLGLLNDPVMCESCQNSFCRNCIDSWLERNNTCPMKCKKISFIEVNRTLKTLLEMVLIQCACGTKVSLLKYPDHKVECMTITCFNCKENVQLKNLRIQSIHSIDEINNKVLGTPGHDLQSKISFRVPDDVKTVLAFQLFIITQRHKGFIGADPDYSNLYMTHSREEALFFSIVFQEGKKYLKCYVPQKGWYFVEPHYDLGVLIRGKKPSDSIELNPFNNTMISSSGRTNGTPLAMRLTDFRLYFYTKEELYQPCTVKCIYATEDFGTYHD